MSCELGKKLLLKLLKHHRDHPCLQELLVLDALEAAAHFGVS